MRRLTSFRLLEKTEIDLEKRYFNPTLSHSLSAGLQTESQHNTVYNNNSAPVLYAAVRLISTVN